MAKQKFKIGDFVEEAIKAPKWFSAEIEKHKSRLVSMVVNGISPSYDGPSYTISFIDADGKTFRNINVKASYVDLSDKKPLTSAEKTLKNLEEKIVANNTTIEKLQLDNARIANRIRLVQELNLDNIDNYVLDSAMKLLEAAIEHDTHLSLGKAYSIAQSLNKKK